MVETDVQIAPISLSLILCSLYKLHIQNPNSIMGEQNGAAGQTPTCSVEEFSSTAFDYIVCGGGTAGLVIAARLSENPEVTVGVIEAGKYRIGDPLVDMPAALFQMFGDPEYDWCLHSAPQVGSCPSSHVKFSFLHESQ
jgi:hypothetical protein